MSSMKKDGGYEHVRIHIRGTPNSSTLAKLAALHLLRQSATVRAQCHLNWSEILSHVEIAIDALIVGIETQDVTLPQKDVDS